MVCLNTLNFLKAVFHKFHLVHSWMLCPIFYQDKKENILSMFHNISIFFTNLIMQPGQFSNYIGLA